MLFLIAWSITFLWTRVSTSRSFSTVAGNCQQHITFQFLTFCAKIPNGQMILLLIEAGKTIARYMRPVSRYGMEGVLKFWIDGFDDIN